MGFFDEYETAVEEIPTGFGLPLGTYPVVLSDIKNFQKKNGAWSTVISFTVDTMNDPDGRSGKEDIWLNKPVKGDKNADINARIGKQTMLEIGIPESALGAFNADTDKEKVVGTTGVLNITAGKDGYTNKKFVKTAEASGVAEGVTVPETKAEAPLDLSGW
jgi:hypothetical protein